MRRSALPILPQKNMHWYLCECIFCILNTWSPFQNGVGFYADFKDKVGKRWWIHRQNVCAAVTWMNIGLNEVWQGKGASRHFPARERSLELSLPSRLAKTIQTGVGIPNSYAISYREHPMAEKRPLKTSFVFVFRRLMELDILCRSIDALPGVSTSPSHHWL